MPDTDAKVRDWFTTHVKPMPMALICGLSIVVVMHYADYNWVTSLAAGVTVWAVVGWLGGRTSSSRPASPDAPDRRR